MYVTKVLSDFVLINSVVIFTIHQKL